MPKNRSAKDRMMLPGTIDRVVVCTVRGQYYVRKWPKKRGTPTDPVQLSRIKRFGDANRLAKFVRGGWWKQAIEQAKGTGLYPRDILVQAMLTGQADVAETNGDYISYKEFFLEEAVFQGCTVQRTAGQGIAINTETAIIWQTPIIQTVPIWNAATPTRLVVPTGVQIVNLKGSVRSAAAVNGTQFLLIRNQAAALLGAQSVTQNATVNLQCETGPIYVTPGDWFDLRVFLGAAGTISGVVQTWFAMEILATT